MKPFPPVVSSRGRARRLFAAPLALGLLAASACAPDTEIARGEELYDACAPCHGDDGAGDESLGAPAIAGAQGWYLAGQLRKFRSGQRGYHHTDAEGLRMRPMSRALLQDEDVDAVVAYLTSLPIPDPDPTGSAGDAESGEEEYLLLCANCHGRDGRGVDLGVEALNAPSLLHLNDWYIASSLRKYREAVRGAELGDAGGATMRASVTGFSDERIDDVTAYVMTMQRLPRKAAAAAPPPLPAVTVDAASLPEGVTVAMVEEGQEIFNGTAGVCFTCHLREGRGGPLAPDLSDDVWLNIDGAYGSIVEIVESGVPEPVEYPGVMQPRAGMPLSDDQVRAVAAYVFSLSR